MKKRFLVLFVLLSFLAGCDKKANEPVVPACKEKVFNQKYSYFYATQEECQKQGNNAFFDVTDNVDPEVFTYGCEAITDDCGTVWYGVYFNKYSENGNYRVYY